MDTNNDAVALVVIDEKPAVLTTNFEEVKAYVTAQTAKYKNLMVTDDPAVLKAAKNDLATLTHTRTAIDSFRKEMKKEMSKPITEMENQCKELIALIGEAEKPLNNDIQLINDKVRDRRRKEAEDQIALAVDEFRLDAKYASGLIVKDFYLNLTGTKKEVKEDVRKEAEALRVLQDQEKQNRQKIADAVASENNDLPTPMDSTRFYSMLENDTPIAYILSDIRDRAEEIRAAAKAAAEEAERRIREEQRRRAEEESRKAEEERAAKEEKERIAREEAEKIAKEEAEKKEAEKVQRYNANSVAALFGMNPPEPEQPKPVVQPMPYTQPQAEIWTVSLDITGTREELAAFNRFLRENKISYVIKNQKRIV